MTPEAKVVQQAQELPTEWMAISQDPSKVLGVKIKVALMSYYNVAQAWQDRWDKRHPDRLQPEDFGRPVLSIEEARIKLQEIRPTMVKNLYAIYELMQDQDASPEAMNQKLHNHGELEISMVKLLDQQEEISLPIVSDKAPKGEPIVNKEVEKIVLKKLILKLWQQGFIDPEREPEKVDEKVAFTAFMYEYLARNSKDVQIGIKNIAFTAI